MLHVDHRPSKFEVIANTIVARDPRLADNPNHLILRPRSSGRIGQIRQRSKRRLQTLLNLSQLLRKLLLPSPQLPLLSNRLASVLPRPLSLSNRLSRSIPRSPQLLHLRNQRPPLLVELEHPVEPARDLVPTTSKRRPHHLRLLPNQL